MKTQIVAIDLGFGYLKLVSECISFRIPSIIGCGFKQTFKGIKKNKTFKERLGDLHVNINNNEWFIGELAVEQEVGTFIFDENRVANEKTRAILLAAVALMNDYSGINSPIYLITGLPLSHYKDEALKKSYKEELKGIHYVTIIDNEITVTKEVIIDQVEVFPQAIGAFYNIVLNEKGMVNPDFKVGRYAVIDQGYHTLDYVEISEDFKIIERGTGTKEKNIGVKDLLQDFLIRLQQQYRENAYDLSDIDMLEILENKYFELNGRKYDLSNQVEELYEYQAHKIFYKLKPVWGNFNFKSVYLTGGIAEHLIKYLPIKNLSIARDDLDCQFSNAEGFYKLGKRQFHDY